MVSLLEMFAGKFGKYAKGKRPQKGIYGRLLALAAHALAEVFGYQFLS